MTLGQEQYTASEEVNNDSCRRPLSTPGLLAFQVYFMSTNSPLTLIRRMRFVLLNSHGHLGQGITLSHHITSQSQRVLPVTEVSCN